MKRETSVASLSENAYRFEFESEAYEVLRQYIEGAEVRLRSDPDRAEVLRDLEFSIGERLQSVLAADSRPIVTSEVREVLDRIGVVEGEPVEGDRHGEGRKVRRLWRVDEGKQISGVCQGISVYSEMDVAWVRTIFIFLTLGTAGLFLLVYFVMALLLPPVDTVAAAAETRNRVGARSASA